MLELLASQAAISLDHARLYADLIQENHDRRRAEEAVRASEERWSKLAGDSPNIAESEEAFRRIVRDGDRTGDVISRMRAQARRLLGNNLSGLRLLY